MSGFKAKITNTDALKRALLRHQREKAQQLRAGLRAGAQYLLDRSLILVPRMTEDLANSAKVRVRGSGFDVQATAGYGTDYAVEVHENPEWAHGEQFNIKHADAIALAPPDDPFYFKRGPLEQSKFLETPLIDDRREIAMSIVEQMHK